MILDLGWPWMISRQFFWKFYTKIFILRYNFTIFNWVRNLTYLTYSCDPWPLLTFVDLETNFFENLSPRASFWGIICVFSINFEIWPFWHFTEIFDLWWPLMTSRRTFWKLHAKSFILRYNLTIFKQVRNLTFSTFFSLILTLSDP